MSRVFKVDYIPDPDRGRPLWNAKIFVGVANQDPTIPSNQIQLTGDIGFPVGQSIPVPQPVRTNAGGITVYNNSPLDLNAPGQEYAIQIFDRNDNLIYNFPQVDGSVVMNTTSQEEVTGLTIWPEVGEAVIGQTIPAGTDAIRYPFNGRSTLFTIKPPVAVTGTITNITINSSGIGELEVDNSDVYDLAEFNSFIAANDGDSQLAGGNIWPLSSQVVATDSDVGLVDVSILRLNDSGTIKLFRFPEPVSGDIDSIGTPSNELVDVTVSGTPYTLINDKIKGEANLESLGYKNGDDISELIQAIANYPSVTKITSGDIDSFVISIAVEVTKSNVEIDLPNILWTGDYDLYPGGSSDRTAGVINAVGIRSTTPVTTITGAILDGQSVYTFGNAGSFSVGDFIRISNGTEIAYITRIEAINGNDVTLDYISGWDVAVTGSVEVFTSEPIQDVHINVKSITDTVGSSTDDNRPSGIGLKDHASCSANIEEAITLYNPAIISTNSWEFKSTKCHNRSPRGVGAGQGYAMQLNNSLRDDVKNISGEGLRHILDFTRGAYSKARNLWSVDGQQIQLLTHGAYEHDIEIDGYTISGDSAGFLSVANSGASFGERTTRFTLRNGRGAGSFNTVNANLTKMVDCVIGANGSGSRRIGQDTELVRTKIREGGNVFLQGRTDRPQGEIIIRGGSLPDCIFLDFSSALRVFDNSKCGWFTNDGGTTLYPSTIRFDGGMVTSTQATTLKVDESVIFDGAAMWTDSVAASNGFLCEVPTYTVNGGSNHNSAIISLESTDNGKLSVANVAVRDPNAARTAGLFRVRGGDGCVASVSNIPESQYTGSGSILDFDRSDATNLRVMVTGNYLDGPLNIKGSAFGNIVKSITTSNMVDDISDLPTPSATYIVANNVEI